MSNQKQEQQQPGRGPTPDHQHGRRNPPGQNGENLDDKPDLPEDEEEEEDEDEE